MIAPRMARLGGIRVGFASLALVAVIAVPTWAIGNRSTFNGKPCPRASQLAYIHNVKDAVPAAESADHLAPNRALIRELKRGDRSIYAEPAARACGRAVVHLSVYVQVHRRGINCRACDLHAFVVRYRTGRYRVWEAY
jgi:hypothetical protein